MPQSCWKAARPPPKRTAVRRNGSQTAWVTLILGIELAMSTAMRKSCNCKAIAACSVSPTATMADAFMPYMRKSTSRAASVSPRCTSKDGGSVGKSSANHTIWKIARISGKPTSPRQYQASKSEMGWAASCGGGPCGMPRAIEAKMPNVMKTPCIAALMPRRSLGEISAMKTGLAIAETPRPKPEMKRPVMSAEELMEAAATKAPMAKKTADKTSCLREPRADTRGRPIIIAPMAAPR
mmetsp:Transcript_56705/g.164482  ORF Transcript_56705/g.164482 Transcript_56705/m.164482 type:complete len:238 (-) Transcript_56705:42-755(-)